MRRWLILVTAAMLVMALPGVAGADHDPPGQPIEASNTTAGFVAGPEGAEWEIIRSFFAPLGFGFTDIDFFTRDGETYVSAGTLAGDAFGGQTIIQLTQGGEVDPTFVSAHPSASCITDVTQAFGLQHDAEATPKGDLGLNTVWGEAGGGGDAQLILDSTDNPGRCHDQGPLLGFAAVPQGGLEIIDITDIENPVEIALTSHIGEAHTVNVDPKRPHIAYAVTSDGVPVRADEDDLDGDGNTEEPIRENEDPEDSDRFDLDGFEVVDLSSCMGFAPDATVEQKRGLAEDGSFLEGEGCRPEVYRYRFELGWTLGTFDITQTGCHELAIHPNDIISCAAPNGTLLLDMSGAFDAEGKPRGEPLPCRVRESTSNVTSTDAPVIDCVIGENEADLTVPAWLQSGAPSLAGVKMLGFVNHGGRDQGNNASHSPTEDIAVAHEAELTHSGNFVFSSDERGGGVVPPDAACLIPGSQPAQGNGGLHAFPVDQLYTEYPSDDLLQEDRQSIAERARESYALNPDGEKAIYRAIPRIPAPSLCTAHVFQQIPGQNRIFMGWYTQGTQVVDYIEHDDGTFEWQEAGWFIPEASNTWVSHVFDFQENEDGTWTYWGVASNFLSLRNALDVWKVTMPAPAQFEEPAPAPEPEPEPEPAPEEEQPLPVTGGGLALASLVLFGGATALVARRRRRSR